MNAHDRPGTGWLRSRAALQAVAVSIAGAISTHASDWTTSTNVALKLTYDSNVFLQDTEPSPLIPGAARPSRESMVTSITPRAAFDFKPCAGFNVSGSYAPEVVVFHSEHSEDHVAHRAGLRFHGVVGKVTWQLQHSFTWIDGSSEGLTFGGPGGAPAIGGIAIRDRREAFVYRNSFGAFHKHGKWFFRPAFSSYVHDFRTTARNPAEFPFYQNYVDRNDINVGLDAGYRIVPDGYLFLAYRWGWQHEPSLPRVSFDYSNNYRRLLVGFEGKVNERIRLNLFVGPDWRDFNHKPPAGFDPTPQMVYIEGSAVFTCSAADTFTLSAKRFAQPAFGAPSAYEDITYEVSWRHMFDARVSLTAGYRAYGGAWLRPVTREDWIYTPTVSLSLKHNRRLDADLAWSLDEARSSIPNCQGREFRRHQVSVSLRYGLFP